MSRADAEKAAAGLRAMASFGVSSQRIAAIARTSTRQFGDLMQRCIAQIPAEEKVRHLHYTACRSERFGPGWCE